MTAAALHQSFTLDVRALPGAAARQALLRSFDTLEVGDSLTLVASDAPLRLLHILQSERKGLFEWSPLDDEAGSWHVEVARRDAVSGERLFRVFARGLNRHIRFEEELLFPAFEARSGVGDGGPTGVMRDEHRQIRMLLEEIERNLEGSPAVVEELRIDLHRILGNHNVKEERILYPAIDMLSGECEADALVARIQAFPS